MANNVSNKRRYFATALAIALVFFFGFAFTFGTTPVANAESSHYDYSDSAIIYTHYGFTSRVGETNSFNFNGAPDFNMNFQSFNSNAVSFYDEPIIEFRFQDYGQYSGLGYFSLFEQYSTFGIDITGAFRFPYINVLNNYISFTIPEFVSRTVYMLVYTTDSENWTPLTCYRLNDVLLSDWSVVTSYDIPYSGDSVRQYKSRVASKFDIEFIIEDPSVNSYFQLIRMELPSGTYNLRGVSSSAVYSYCAGLWYGSVESNDYNNGYNAGYDIGYNAGVTSGKVQGYNDGYSAGVSAGESQAFNTVNDTSASYSAGYSKGVESAGNYTFMSLISSVIDAPIRAFFGYTENGVKHPGLFNLNILGYDMSAFVLSLFSACVIIMIIKLSLGGK